MKPQQGETIYDPTCGSGGFLLNADKYAKVNYHDAKSVRLFGQELVWNTWAICNINMILHGLDARIEQGDTIRDPKFKEEDNLLLLRTFDKVMANFPFSLENWAQNGEPKKDKKGKAVNKKDETPQLEYKKEFTDSYQRLVYGIPPYSNGDFAFLQHIIASLDDKGKAAYTDIIQKGEYTFLLSDKQHPERNKYLTMYVRYYRYQARFRKFYELTDTIPEQPLAYDWSEFESKYQ